MANIVKYQEKYQEQVYNLFVDFRNEEDFFKFEKLYMRDTGHGGSFWDRKNKDYRKVIEY